MRINSKSEDISDCRAMHTKGLHAYYGIKTKQSYDVAFKCFQKAYEMGCKEALVDIGVCYMRGYGVKKDTEKGAKLITACYENGMPHSYHAYGRMLELGEGVEQDLEKAFECYTKATEWGEMRAFSNLGAMYLTGSGCEKDVDKGIEAFKRGHDFSEPMCSANLGLMYLKGILGVEKDHDKAFKYLSRAVELGNIPSYARLADCYDKGLGCDKDVTRADDLYSMAYAKGDYNGLAGMAVIRKRGDIKASPHKVFKMLREASGHGIMEAQYNLGMCYLEGYGTKKSLQDAIYALSRATSQYDLRSLKELNRLQLRLEGPSEDLRAKLIIAARCDDVESMMMLWSMDSKEKAPEDISGWFWETYGEGLAVMHLPIGCDKNYKTYSFIDGDRFRMNVVGPDAVEHTLENEA